MRHLLRSLPLLLLLLCACGSGGDDDSGDIITKNTLELSAYSLTFAGTGESKPIDVVCNAEFTVRDCPEWVSVSQSEATILVTAAPNPSTTLSRSGSLRVVCGQINRTVKLTQEAADEQLVVATRQLEFASEGGTQRVELIANCAWEVAALPAWLTASPAAGSGNATVALTAAPSAEERPRAAAIVLRTVSRALSSVITVTQAPFATTLTLSPTTLTLPAKRATATLHIGGNATWTAESDVPWAHIDATGGQGERTLTLTLDDNPTTARREATITVRSAQDSLTTVITQIGGTKPGADDNKPL